jgi:hypothetical protein
MAVAASAQPIGETLKRARLFLISYAPLWLMLVFRSLPKHPTLSSLTGPPWEVFDYAALAAWAFLDAWRLVRGAQRKGVVRRLLSDLSDQGANAGGYVATYLLPFLATGPPDIWAAIAEVLYFLLLLTIFVRSELALINPTLYVLGWRVTMATMLDPALISEPATTQPGSRGIVIYRRSEDLRSPVEVVQLAGAWVVKRVVT